VLEIAAGTGVVTRAMATALPETVSIVATDLHQSMLDQAAARGTTRPVMIRLTSSHGYPTAIMTRKPYNGILPQAGSPHHQSS
jgi:predicted O-methyltransferase YrrM